MIICDIDWTIANCDHRYRYLKKDIINKVKCCDCKHLQGRKKVICNFNGDCENAKITQKAWNEFFKPDRVMCDSVIKYARDVLEYLDHKHILYYYSGRFEKLRSITERWLIENRFPYHDRLFLRQDGDLRTGLETKKESLKQFIGEKRVMIIDDDERLEPWAIRHDFHFFLARDTFWENTYHLLELFI